MKVSFFITILTFCSINFFAQSSLSKIIDEGDIISLQQLITQGADVNSLNSLSVPIIVNAVLLEDSTSRYNISKLLVENGADINVTIGTDRWTPLLVAAKRKKWDLVQLFLQYGGNPLIKNDKQQDLIHFLYLQCKMPLIYRLLLENNISLSYKDAETGNNLLDIACNCNDKILFEFIHKNIATTNDTTQLSYKSKIILYSRFLTGDDTLANIQSEYSKYFKRNTKQLKKLNPISDYYFGRQLEEYNQKPSIYIFNGDTCSQCIRLMEEIIENNRLRKKLKRRYNIVWLYGYDKTLLTKNQAEIFTLRQEDEGNNVRIKPVNKGTININILLNEFNINSMPTIFIPTENLQIDYSKVPSLWYMLK